MNNITRQSRGLLVAAWFLFPVMGLAQDAEGPKDGAPAPAPEVVVPTRSAPVFSSLDEVSTLSIDEKKSQADRKLQGVRDVLKRGLELLKEARRNKDVIQLNCVNDQLTQVKGLLRISEQASLQMYEAIASATDSVVNTEFVKIAAASQRSKSLAARMERCVGGEEGGYEDDAELLVTLGEGLDSGDGGDDGSGGGGISDVTSADGAAAGGAGAGFNSVGGPGGGPTAPPVASRI